MSDTGQESKQKKPPSAEQVEAMLKWEFRVDGTLYPIDLGTLELGEYEILERITHGAVRNLGELLEQVLGTKERSRSPAATIALLFVAMRRVNSVITEADVRGLKGPQIELKLPEDDEEGPTEAADDEQDDVDRSQQKPDGSGGPGTPGSTESAPGSSSD